MEVTAKMLRGRVGEVLACVDRGETVTITYRGKPRAKLVGIGQGDKSPTRDMRSFPAFGMWKDRDDLNDACAQSAGMLVDTDVLIWFLRGQLSARRAVENCDSVDLSAVTYMELAQGARDKEELRLLRHTIRLNGWRVLPLTEEISHRATMYIENYALSHGLRLADALIAASAVQYGAALMTANTRHYECVRDIALERYRP